MKRFTLLFVFTIFSQFIVGQRLQHVLGDVIIRLEKTTDIEKFKDRFNTFRSVPTQIKVKNKISENLNIYLINIDHNSVNEIEFMHSVQSTAGVSYASSNDLLQLRSTPDDPLYNRQWQLSNLMSPSVDIGAEKAWAITQGGVTPRGDSIVIAIIDDGIELNHPDIIDNIWVNRSEVAGNEIDDDNNGFIDDVHGYNVGEKNGNVNTGHHGISVAGMIGAAGNNGIGVSGVNWKVKIMTVVLDQATKAQAFEAYDYILSQRKLYNQSNGEKGAFVVATNSSWGLDFATPDHAESWCEFYDSLGVHGILNCASTTNLNIDVDVEGDLPSTCTSPYLIVTTAVDKAGKRSQVGYGAVSIDLGAPGKSVMTTTSEGTYNERNGTSFASPMVAGVIGLLYSSPCSELSANALTDPGLTASTVKNLVLAGVERSLNLDNFTVTGGILNAYNSLQISLAACSSCTQPLSLESGTLGSDSAIISWVLVDSSVRNDVRYRISGQIEWTMLEDVSSPLTLNELTACSSYEIQINSVCEDTTSNWSSQLAFKTDGCCSAPTNFVVDNSKNGMATLSWDPQDFATGYTVNVKHVDSTEWISYFSTDTSYILSPVEFCQSYNVQIYTECETGNSDLSEVFTFESGGCSACSENIYCKSFGNNSTSEYIEKVSIGSIDFMSGNNDGYGNFTLVDTINTELSANSKYNLEVVPGFGNSPSMVLYRVWIDYNMDGVFGSEELVAQNQQSTIENLNREILIPNLENFGSTLMRVSLKWPGLDNNPAESCDSIAFGEVEDYCVNLVPDVFICPEVENPEIEIKEMSITLVWDTIPKELGYLIRHKKASKDKWSDEEVVLDTMKVIDGLSDCTEYEVQIRTVCEIDTSDYKTFLITTAGKDCVTGIEELKILSGLSVFPNPVKTSFTTEFYLTESTALEISVFTIDGRSIYRNSNFYNVGFQRVKISESEKWHSGLYVMLLKSPKGIISKKIMKI